MPNLHDDMHLSPALAPHTNSQKDVTDDVLISVDPPTSLNHSCEFEEEDFKNARELEAICFQESYEEVFFYVIR